MKGAIISLRGDLEDTERKLGDRRESLTKLDRQRTFLAREITDLEALKADLTAAIAVLSPEEPNE